MTFLGRLPLAPNPPSLQGTRWPEEESLNDAGRHTTWSLAPADATQA
jgi:hypothetical protein